MTPQKLSVVVFLGSIVFSQLEKKWKQLSHYNKLDILYKIHMFRSQLTRGKDILQNKWLYYRTLLKSWFKLSDKLELGYQECAVKVIKLERHRLRSYR